VRFTVGEKFLGFRYQTFI